MGDTSVEPVTPAAMDSAAFAEWVGEHLAVLAAVAVQQVGVGDAEDVVQEALIRAWRRRATFDPRRGSARGWLAAIVLDQARRYRTRRRPDAHVPDDRLDGVPLDARIDLGRAVGALPRRQREVVTLHYLADLGVAEVARVLNISEGTVKSTLSDARRALRESLEQT